MEFNNLELKDFYTTDFAYWIGVVQTDGYLKRLFRNNRTKVRFSIGLCVGNKSKPMLRKFINLSKSLFEINGSFLMVLIKKDLKVLNLFLAVLI